MMKAAAAAVVLAAGTVVAAARSEEADMLLSLCGVRTEGLIFAEGLALDHTYSMTQKLCEPSEVEPCRYIPDVLCAAGVETDAAAYVNVHTMVDSVLAVNETEPTHSVSKSCFTKVAFKINTDLPRLQQCVQVNQEDALRDAFRRCDDLAGCRAVGLFQPPNMPPYMACFYGEVDDFSRKKIGYPGKLFLRQDRCSDPIQYFGYLSYPEETVPVSSSRQVFGSDSGYTKDDCASMCDALGSRCAGFVVVDSVCREILGSIDKLGKPTALSGAQAFRKRYSSADTLNVCELGNGGCVVSKSPPKVQVEPESNLMPVAAAAGAVGAGVIGFLALRKYRDVARNRPHPDSVFDIPVKAHVPYRSTVSTRVSERASISSSSSIESGNPCFAEIDR